MCRYQWVFLRTIILDGERNGPQGRDVARWREAPRFHVPLIELAGRISRIRLPEKDLASRGTRSFRSFVDVPGGFRVA